MFYLIGAIVVFLMNHQTGNSVDVGDFNLTVIHQNDFHSHFLPIKMKNDVECFQKDYETDPECVAGVARTVAEIKRWRNAVKNLLHLNAGDYFQGSSWYSLYKSPVVAEFFPLMVPDVMTLGNHEFDDGPDELARFIRTTKNVTSYRIVCCNIVVNQNSSLYGLVEKSTVKVIDGHKIAIIGYLTPNTTFLSSPGPLIQIRDEIESVREEIESLKAKHSDLNIFIALGHSGLDPDLVIAQAIPELDVLVGGHSHTYLLDSDLTPPGAEKPAGDYPIVFKHEIAPGVTKPTLVVQAYAYGKYMGWLDLTFDKNGDISHYEGYPIFLNSTHNQDPQTLRLVKQIFQNVSDQISVPIGYANGEFPLHDCRSNECALGNLITQSFVEQFKKLDKKLAIRKADECDLIALINGGNMRVGFDQGEISYQNVLSTMPFANMLGVLTINGSGLFDLMHQSAEYHDRGGFMQMTGLRARFRLTGPTTKSGFRKATLVDLNAHCGARWVPVVNHQHYSVIINSFIANGGDNYHLDKSNWQDYQIRDSDILKEYIAQVYNITPILDGRIRFDSGSSLASMNQCLLLLLPVVSYLLVGII